MSGARQPLPGTTGPGAEKSGGARGGLTAAVRRYARLIKWAFVGVLVVSFFLIVRVLPVGEAGEAMEAWVEGLGGWGPVVVGLIYVVAVVLLFPASLLTLAAGALFGLLGGAAVASVAATTGAALAFLIARYLAREHIANWVKQYPKFAAIDRAIS